MRRLLLLAFIAMPAAAQAPPAEPAPEQLAFEDAGVRMTVPVTIAGAGAGGGPYPFIVDTGAQRTVISRELAAPSQEQPRRR